MWNRLPAALALTVALSACRETQPANTMFVGLGGVRVIDVRLVDSGDANTTSGGGGALTYVLAHLAYTNDTANDFTPEAGRFILLDRFGNSYAGVESGSSVLMGIANSHQPLHAAETREYVVGFRVADSTISGTIAYEP
jgi:hypothetical protein